MARYLVIILCLMAALVVQSLSRSDRLEAPFGTLPSKAIPTVRISGSSGEPAILVGSSLSTLIAELAEIRVPARYALSPDSVNLSDAGLAPPQWRYEFLSATGDLLFAFDVGGLHPTLGYRYLRLESSGELLLAQDPISGWGVETQPTSGPTVAPVTAADSQQME